MTQTQTLHLGITKRRMRDICLPLNKVGRRPRHMHALKLFEVRYVSAGHDHANRNNQRYRFVGVRKGKEKNPAQEF